MEYRQLGQTEIKVSAITYGAWAIGGWMWGGADRKDAIRAIHASIDKGVTSIDTAPIYGQGTSEDIVGEALEGASREKVQIMTKFGMRWDETKGTFAFKSEDNSGKAIDIYKYAGKESIIKECEDSLRRLRTDYIDLYQIHWPDASTPIEETFEAVYSLQKLGKILAAGVCNYDVAQMKTADKVVSLASNQVPFSMVRREIEKELVPHCIQHQRSILAYSPLQGGLLTGKIKPDHQFNAGDHRAKSRYYKPVNIERVNKFLETLGAIAQDKKATVSQLVIRWTIEQPGITVALVGARDSKQAEQNAEAINVKLSEEEMKYINDHLDKLDLVE